MVKKRKILIYGLIFLLILIVGTYLVKATTVQSLGTFQRNSCVDLKQTCANCTYVNITSILFPNSTEALGASTAMQQQGTVYNYTFCQTSSNGQYIYWVTGNPDGTPVVAGVTFEITPTGTVLDTSQGIIYIAIMVILMFLFVVCVWGAIKLPWKNERNAYDEVIKVTWRKYLKMLSACFAYVLLVWIVFFAWNIIYAYLAFSGLGNIFWIIYTILVGLLIPVFFGMILLFLVAFLSDRKLQSMINKFTKGLT